MNKEGVAFLEKLQKEVEDVVGKKINIPNRYKDFILNEEWKKYQHRSATVLSDQDPFDFGIATEIVWFTDINGIEDVTQSDMYADWGEDDSVHKESFLPLADLVGKYSTSSAYLVVDIFKSECPVRFFHPDLFSFEPLSNSLDEFLGSLREYNPEEEGN